MRQKEDVCYFCDEFYHKSAECKKHRSIKSREMVAKKKNMCRFCFIISDKIHLHENKECPTNDKCIGWFSTDHHSIFCPTRIKELKKSIFLPKIDETLMSRFAETLEIDEKYLLATSSALPQKVIPLKNVKIIEGIGGRFVDIEDSDSTIFIVTLKFFISKSDIYHLEKLLKNELICRAEVVRIYDVKIPADLFLQMFSPITRFISTEKLESEVTFSVIIEKVPNIEVFEIKDYTLKANGETWIKDLMKFKKGKNFRELCIYLDTIEFDIELSKEFILTKCVHNVLISIFYDANLSKVGINNFVDKIGNVFFEEECQRFRRKPHISVYGRNFTLDIEQPKRANRKRKIDSQ